MATKTGDVQFQWNSVDYDFMLALNSDGQKAWQVKQLHTQPPSLAKNEVAMTIKAGAKLRLADGTSNSAIMDIANVKTKLRILVDATTEITLNGYDDQTYKVLFMPEATRIMSKLDETRRLPEYDIDLMCLDRHQ